MTDSEINIAIAEALGWKHEEGESVYSIWNYNVDPSGKRHDCDFGRNRMAGIPDYCHDLNAMHEAVKVLSETQKDEMYERLCKLTGRVWHSINATARQRAEAFIKSMGLWKEKDAQR